MAGFGSPPEVAIHYCIDEKRGTEGEAEERQTSFQIELFFNNLGDRNRGATGTEAMWASTTASKVSQGKCHYNSEDISRSPISTGGVREG